MLADTAWIAFAVGLPWLTGALFVSVCWRSRQPGHPFLVLGMGFPLGMLGVIVGYRILDALGIGLQFGLNAGLQMMMAGVLACWLLMRRTRPIRALQMEAGRPDWQQLRPGARWLIGLVAAWLLLRWLGLLIEVVHRPLFPWDAWYAYGAQAKVWFYTQALNVFADGNHWFETGEPAWAIGGVRHPPGIGLFQLWMVQALGRWDDAWMNLPWPVAGLSLALVLFGLARVMGAGLVPAALGVWLIMSLPMLNTQVVLAGYGDLWITAYLLIAVGSAALLCRGPSPGLGVLALAALLGLLMIKEVGLYWSLIVAIGLLSLKFSLLQLAIGAGTGVLLVMAGLWWTGSTVELSVLGQYGFDGGQWVFPGYTAMWGELLTHLLVIPNWHLFWYLVIAAWPMALLAGRSDPALRIVAVVGGLAVVGLAGLFAFSELGSAVSDGTSVNRMLLPAAPVLGLALTLWFDRRVAPEWS